MCLLISQPCPLASVTTVEVPSLDLKSGSGLEIFLRNMAHERIQTHLNDVIFRRDVEQCEREQVAPYKVKFADNRALVDAVFKVNLVWFFLDVRLSLLVCFRFFVVLNVPKSARISLCVHPPFV